MNAEWDPLERFQHLPKPKRLLGNEACEIVWPYAVLLENIVKIHPFTKSLYVYYPQHALTARGAEAAALARRFSRECLIPICFHNSQCYVETELLLEHGDTAWVVVHCIDGTHEVVRVDPDALRQRAAQSVAGGDDENDGNSSSNGGSVAVPQDALRRELLATVLETASRLGSAVAAPELAKQQLNERALQNAFIRVDYQWMGDTEEERTAHLVRWVDPDDRGVQPLMYQRDESVAEWLNAEGGRPLDSASMSLRALDRKSLGARVTDPKPAPLSSYFARYTRISSTYGKSRGVSGRDLV
jgi:hypothetical protein